MHATFESTYEEKKVLLSLGLESIDSDVLMLSDLSVDVTFDIANFDGDALLELFKIFGDETYLDSVNDDDIFALYDSIAGMSQSAEFKIGYLWVNIEDYAIIEIEEFRLAETLALEGSASLEISFDMFMYAEFSEEEDEYDTQVIISGASLLIEFEASGVGYELPKLLPIIMDSEGSDLEAFVEGMELYMILDMEITIDSFVFADEYEDFYLELEDFRFDMSIATGGGSSLNITLKSAVSDEFEIYGLDIQFESEYGDVLKYVLNLITQIPEDGLDLESLDFETLIDDYLSITGDTNARFSIGFDRMCFEDETTYLLIGLEEGYETPVPTRGKAVQLTLELAIFEVDDDLKIGANFKLSLSMSDDAIVEYSADELTYVFLDGFYLDLNFNTGGESENTASLEMGFNKFFFKEISEYDSDLITELEVLNLRIYVEAEASGVRTVLSNILFFTSTEELDLEALLADLDMLRVGFEFSVDSVKYRDTYDDNYLNIEEFLLTLSVSTRDESTMLLTLKSAESHMFEIYGLEITFESEYGDILKYLVNLVSQIPEDGPEFGYEDVESLLDDYFSFIGDTNTSFSIGFDRIRIGYETEYLLIGLEEGYETPVPTKGKAVQLSLELAIFEVDDDLRVGADFTLSLSMSDDSVVKYVGTSTYVYLDGFYLNLNASTGLEPEIMASLEVGFNKFFFQEVSEEDSSEYVELEILNLTVSLEADASGVRTVLSNLLSFTNTGEPDLGTLLGEVDMRMWAEFRLSVDSVKYLDTYGDNYLNIEELLLTVSLSTIESSNMYLTLKSADSHMFDVYGLEIVFESNYGDIVESFTNAILLDYDEDDPEDMIDIMRFLVSLAENSSISLSVEFDRLYIDGEMTLLIGLSEGYESPLPDREKAVRIFLELGMYQYEDGEQMFNIEGSFSLEMSDDTVILFNNSVMSLSLKGLQASLEISTLEPVDIWSITNEEEFDENLAEIFKNVFVEIKLSFDEFVLESVIGDESTYVEILDLMLKIENNIYDIFNFDNELSILGDYEITIGTLIIRNDMGEEFTHISFYDLVMRYDESFDETYLFAVAEGGVTADISADGEVFSTKISDYALPRLDNIFSIDIVSDILTVNFRESGSTDEIPSGFLMIEVGYATISDESNVLKGERFIIGSEILVADRGTVEDPQGWIVDDVTYLMDEYVKLTDSDVIIKEVGAGIFTITYKDEETVLDVKGYIAGATVFEYIPEKEGYTFAGWDSALPGTMPEENLTFTASWTINKYTLTFFYTKGGSVVESITQNYGSDVTVSDPTRTGYTFDGWSPSLPGTMPAENMTFTASWTINTYTLEFDTDEGTAIEPITRNYGSAVVVSNPTRTGYTFAGWDPALPETMPAENMTFTALWTVNQYTATVVLNGGSFAADPTGWTKETNGSYTKKFDYGTSVSDIIADIGSLGKTGYTFDGYEPSDGTLGITGATLTAQWTINKYTLTFVTDGGSAVGSITQDYGSVVTAPANPTKDGYVFQDWSSDVPSVMPANNMTFTAVWLKLVTIDPDYTGSSVDNLDEDGIAITGNDLEKLKSNAESGDSEYIDINLNKGSVYLPKGAIDLIVDSDDMGLDIRLSLETSVGIEDETILGNLSEDMRAKIANATVVSINLANAKTTQNLGDVKIVIPYTLKEGENGNLVKVYFIGSDGSVEEKSARYFEEGGVGYVEFTTTHFSYYAITFDDIAPAIQSNYLYFIIAAIAILAIGALAIVVTRKSRA